MVENREKILEVKHLKQYFNAGTKNEVRAVDDITFDIYKGETFGLVGESGSGKSTTGRSVIRLYDPTDGEIDFQGTKVHNISGKKDMLQFRRDVQMIFQDPYASLNPKMKIRDIIAEGIDIHSLASSSKERNERINELLELVGLDPDVYATRYPKELSGGQQQRVGIARALAANPDVILMDEPFSALDPITREQLQEELLKLHKKLKKTIVFVTHDMDEALKMGDRIAIMKDGNLLQLDTPEKLLHEPAHGFVEEFMGKHRIIQNPELMPVTEIMAEKVVTIRSNISPERAISLIRQRKITDLLVVDDQDELLGIVSAYDLIKNLDKIKTIDEVMAPAVPFLLNTATAKDAIIMMDTSPFGMIPIVDERHILVGLVNRGSLLSAMSSQWTDKGVAVDE